MAFGGYIGQVAGKLGATSSKLGLDNGMKKGSEDIARDLKGVVKESRDNQKKEHSQRAKDAEAEKKRLGAALADRMDVKGPSMKSAQMGAAKVGRFDDAQSARIDQTAQSQFRNQQMSLAQQLAAQAQGRGPSLATQQMKAATDRGMAQAQSLAASQRGLSAGQRARLAANQMSAVTADAAQAAAQGRIQEQLNAQSTLGNVLAGARGQDIGLATSQADLAQQANMANFQGGLQSALANAQFKQGANQTNAQLSQGANQANLQAALAAQAQRDQMTQFYTGAQLGVDERHTQEELARLGLGNQYSLGVKGMQHQEKMADDQFQKQLIGGFGTAIMGAAMMSDETKKTDIKPAEHKLSEFLANIGTSEYRYKDEKHGKGKFVSPMAQELEKSEIGKSMVVETTEGKMVNYGRAAGTYLSAAAMLHRRLEKLEKAIGEKSERPSSLAGALAEAREAA